MPIDFSDLPKPVSTHRPVDPIEIFRSLPVSDPDINDLWLAQGDALREWHDGRHARDVTITLNTGAGKTLVGLLIAQSLANEGSSHVLYACSSIQLVSQTAEKANAYGLSTTTYARGSFNNELYPSGLAPCITTYQAIFNGKSRFVRDDVSAIVFDDAHAAEHILRSQFTLNVTKKNFPEQFPRLAEVFHDYFRRIGSDIGYAETLKQGDPAKWWFVPPFAVRERWGDVKQVIEECDFTEHTDTLFAWEYLREKLDLCALFVSGDNACFTPPVLPSPTISFLRPPIRRVYLSATLVATDAFVRAFGRKPDQVISPTTTAGECERLILIPSLAFRESDGTPQAKEAVRNRKALIMVPSYRRRRVWQDLDLQDLGDTAEEQVANFRDSAGTPKLCLVARYDGIDLPGDTCRIMVIDDLPSGVGPLERFLWDRLGLVNYLRTTIASRVVQSFGRISRGMSDYGVVLITGKRLYEWLQSPRNQEGLPGFLNRQIELGRVVMKEVSSLDDMQDAIHKCLDRDTGWSGYYREVMDTMLSPGEPKPYVEAERIALAEASFIEGLWLRDYTKAAKALEKSVEDTSEFSLPLAAWHRLWLGYCYELIGDRDRAIPQYNRAHSMAHNLPAYEAESAKGSDVTQHSQVRELTRLLGGGVSEVKRTISQLDRAIGALEPESTPGQVEEALRSIGELLGLEGSRPDKELGTGPDVLWICEETSSALCMEVKSDKDDASVYRKDELGQLRDHVAWVKGNKEVSSILPRFVGPILSVSDAANPDPDMFVIEQSEFASVARDLRSALENLEGSGLPLLLAADLHRELAAHELLWGELIQRFAKHQLVSGDS